MRALVTGSAGLIGSHLVDLLVREGWCVRGYDNIEPRTHPNGKPVWLNPKAEYVEADVRDGAALLSALDGIDVVFHQAAYGGFFPELAKLCDVNVTGTARLLDVIRDEQLPVKKLIVASSQVVYREGAAECPSHGRVQPNERELSDLEAGSWTVRCPMCRAAVASRPTTEAAPAAGDSPYAISKFSQERLVLNWSRQTGIPAVALRYACTYGPRQSIYNPYTGIIAIFCTQLLAGRMPTLYEDGFQTRDFCFVEDVAMANLIVATSDAVDGLAVNVGTGVPVTVRRLAEIVANELGINCSPHLDGDFRPGDLRHLTSDLTRLARTGFVPQIRVEDGIPRYAEWIRRQGEIRDYFATAQARLRDAGLVRGSQSAKQATA